MKPMASSFNSNILIMKNILDLFGNPIRKETTAKSPKKRKPSVSGGTEVQRLFKYQVWAGLEVTGSLDIPVIQPYTIEEPPTELVPFNVAMSSHRYDSAVHFYLNDPLFVRVFRKPERYVNILKRFKYVITPDLSEYLEMPYWMRLFNSCLNKAFAAYWQSQGINIIINVTWSNSDSYDYSFGGIPKGCVIAISSVAIKGHPYSVYRWQQGYQEALKQLTPKLIIRYGDKMPNEREDISIYFDDYIKHLRNG